MCVCVCILLQVGVSGPAQHARLLRCAEISSERRGEGRAVPQEDAALEPETLQCQQGAGVRGQPRPRVQHERRGVLTSTWKTQTDKWAELGKDVKDPWCNKLFHTLLLFPMGRTDPVARNEMQPASKNLIMKNKYAYFLVLFISTD